MYIYIYIFICFQIQRTLSFLSERLYIHGNEMFIEEEDQCQWNALESRISFKTIVHNF
jgi:hypothetical protein